MMFVLGNLVLEKCILFFQVNPVLLKMGEAQVTMKLIKFCGELLLHVS